MERVYVWEKARVQGSLMQIGWVHKIVGLLAVLVGVVALPAASDDRLDRLFAIENIAVDRVARSSSEAQTYAIEEAERTAYQKLLAKLTLAEDRVNLPEMQRSDILALISGFEVRDEQFSSRRYVATMSFRFEPELVSQFLASYGVPHVFSAGGGVVPFHAHVRGVEVLSWEPDSTIETARSGVDWANRLRQYDFLEPTVANRLTISPDLIVGLDPSPLTRRVALEGDRAVLLMVTRWRSETESLLYEARLGGSDLIVSGEVTPAELLASGVSQWEESAAITLGLTRIADAIDRDWKSRLLVDVSQIGTLSVEIPSTRLDDWVTVRGRLEGLSLVRSLQVEKIGIPVSKILLSYTGRLDQLMVAIGEAGLVVDEADGFVRVSIVENSGE